MTDQSDRREAQLHEVLRRPECAVALVAWDRDIVPLLADHQSYWGPVDPGEEPVWVSLTVNGENACCHLQYVPERERFETPERWVVDKYVTEICESAARRRESQTTLNHAIIVQRTE